MENISGYTAISPEKILGDGNASSYIRTLISSDIELQRETLYTLTINILSTNSLNISGSVDLGGGGGNENSYFDFNPAKNTSVVIDGRLQPGNNDFNIEIYAEVGSRFSDTSFYTQEGGGTVSVTLLLLPSEDIGASLPTLHISRWMENSISLNLSQLIPGKTYTVERSKNLKLDMWENFRGFYAEAPDLTLIEVMETGNDVYFYRIYRR